MTTRYWIVELSGREHEVSRREYLFHVWAFLIIFGIPILALLAVFLRLVFEGIRGY